MDTKNDAICDETIHDGVVRKEIEQKESKRKELSRRLRTIIANKKCVYASIMSSRRPAVSKRSKDRQDDIILKKLMKFGKSRACSRNIFPERFDTEHRKNKSCHRDNMKSICSLYDAESEVKCESPTYAITHVTGDTIDDVCSVAPRVTDDHTLNTVNMHKKHKEMSMLFVSFTYIQTGVVMFVSPLTGKDENLLEVYAMETGKLVSGLKGLTVKGHMNCVALRVHDMNVCSGKFAQILIGVFSNPSNMACGTKYSILVWDITDISRVDAPVCITDKHTPSSIVCKDDDICTDDPVNVTGYDLACLLGTNAKLKHSNDNTCDPFYVTDMYNSDSQCIGALVVCGHYFYHIGFRKKRICMVSSKNETCCSGIYAPITCANGIRMIAEFDATSDTFTLRSVVSNRSVMSCDISTTVKYTFNTMYTAELLKPVAIIDMGDYVCPRQSNACMFGIVLENDNGCGVDVLSMNNDGTFTREGGFVVCESGCKSDADYDVKDDDEFDRHGYAGRMYCLHASVVPGTIPCTIAILVRQNSKRFMRVWERVGLEFVCIFNKDVTDQINPYTRTFELYVSPTDGVVYSAFRNGTNILRLSIL